MDSTAQPHRLRRLPVLALSTLFFLLAAGFESNAEANSFGSAYLTGTGCCTMRGMRADVARQAFAEPGVGRVVMQSTWLAPGTGLIQVMYVFAPTGGLDDCGMAIVPRFATEWKVVGSSTYHCQYHSSSTPHNTNTRFSVRRRASTSTSWNSYINGLTMYQSAALSFDTANWGAAGGETFATTPSSNAISFCFGCNGGLKWQRTTTAGTADDWFTIQSSSCDATPDAAQWIVNLPGNSAGFAIYRPLYDSC